MDLPLGKVAKSDLPFGSEFSPSQIELARVLEIAHRHSGNWKAFEAAVRTEYFERLKYRKTSDYNRGKLANNTKLGMIAYGIIDRDAKLTGFGQRLYNIREDPNTLYDALAKHILLNLHGMALVRCIQDMVAAGEVVNLTTLREGLAARGVHYPPGGKHPSMMRLWLAKAGVFVGSRWQVDEHRIEEVLGVNPDEYDVLAGLTQEQRAFVRALANTGVMAPQPANEIVKLATATYGVKFPEKSLPKLVLHALEKAGYITTEKTTSGRGAKPFLVVPTKKLVADIVEPLLGQLAKQTDPRLMALLRKPLTDILKELNSKNRHTAGLALEALGFKLMRFLDMDYVATRLRGSATGGAEVDLIFESGRLVYSRWQVQCKNTQRVSLDDVAKEVGLTHVLKSNVIVMVTTGEIGGEAMRYAVLAEQARPVHIVFIDRHDLDRIVHSPIWFIYMLQQKSPLLLVRRRDFSFLMNKNGRVA